MAENKIAADNNSTISNYTFHAAATFHITCSIDIVYFQVDIMNRIFTVLLLTPLG